MGIKSIAIETTEKAFLPEAYAYQDFFQKKGFVCDLIKKGSPLILDYDAVLLFHGFHPFWKPYPNFIIGEYHSLSTGNYGRFKDLLKRVINVKANFYIFLNEEVRKKLWFSSATPYLIRGMGYHKEDFDSLAAYDKLYDVVYCGSFRPGVPEALYKLANLGLRVALAGFKTTMPHDNISELGRVTPNQARQIIAQSKYGLNYTPDIFPLNIQDSTKVIEYCAAGLGVITNRYQWVNEFEAQRQGRFLSLDEINRKEDVTNFDFVVPKVEDLSWQAIFESLEIEAYLS